MTGNAKPESAIKPKRYRIGDYARYLGVTPDFLKHYEKAGLLEVEYEDNGYRFFPFAQSGQMLECMRLRNCGFTLRKIEELLFDCSGDEVQLALANARERMEKRLARETAILAEQKRLESWLVARREKPEDWEIRDLQGVYYLPHAQGTQFIDDPRIYDILPEWMGWMPVAKSSLRFQMPADGTTHFRHQWGFVLKESSIRQHDIAINDVVEYVAPAKYLVYHYAGPDNMLMLKRLAERTHPIFDLVADLGLTITGDCFMEVFWTAQRKSAREGYGIFRIPVEK